MRGLTQAGFLARQGPASRCRLRARIEHYVTTADVDILFAHKIDALHRDDESTVSRRSIHEPPAKATAHHLTGAGLSLVRTAGVDPTAARMAPTSAGGPEVRV